MPENIEPINLSAETRRRYLNYALSVITSRALPDVRDGLKPVQRRILFAMREEGYAADGRTRKCAGVSGSVIKSFHPHGEAPVYEALVRLAQDFVMRYPLVFGYGNFGSVDGDAAAASRYTECKLMPLAEELMAELGQQTVDFRPTFDGEREEPIVLPARFPHLLVNGSSGIAVGMATNIPPHNLREVIKACLLLIDNPEATTAQLVSLHNGPIKGPDFPLGGKILTDQTNLRRIYEAGQGSIKIQGEWRTETIQVKSKGGRSSEVQQIVIYSIPYGVNKGNLLAAMGQIIAERKLTLVTNMVDESSLDNGMRIVLELKDGADPEAAMAYFFKHTELQSNFSFNFTCLVPGSENAEDLQPKRCGVKEMLQYFLIFRQTTVRRRFTFLLNQLRRRIHILEGLKIILDALDEALALIRASTGRADAASRLRGAFPLDEEQSLAVVDLNLYRIGSLEMKKIYDELKEKNKEAKRLEGILQSENKLWSEVRRELEAFAETYGDKRRTRLADEDSVPEFDPEAYIIKENANIILTKDGWVKRIGRITSIATTRTREGDEVLAVVPGITTEFAIFFTTDGTAFTIRVQELPSGSGYGEPLAKFFRLRDGVGVVRLLTTDPRFTPFGRPLAASDHPPFEGEWHLVVVTKLGNIARLALTPFCPASTKVGRRVVKLAENDEVVFVGVPELAHKTIVLVSSDGHALHFALDDVPVLAGTGKGVKGISLKTNATCLGAHIFVSDRDMLLVENTNGTQVEVRAGKLPVSSRGGKGYEMIKRGGFRALVPREIDLVDWSVISEI